MSNGDGSIITAQSTYLCVSSSDRLLMARLTWGAWGRGDVATGNRRTSDLSCECGGWRRWCKDWCNAADGRSTFSF